MEQAAAPPPEVRRRLQRAGARGRGPPRGAARRNRPRGEGRENDCKSMGLAIPNPVLLDFSNVSNVLTFGFGNYLEFRAIPTRCCENPVEK